MDRLHVAGALRYVHDRDPLFDPAAPILLALPFDATIAGEMVEAVRPLAALGRPILVKDHPMSPFSFAPSPGLERTEIPFSQHQRLSAVIYCITTLGLEAVLAGLPTLRFVPSCRPVVDIMPEGVSIPAAASLAKPWNSCPHPHPCGGLIFSPSPILIAGAESWPDDHRPTT